MTTPEQSTCSSSALGTWVDISLLPTLQKNIQCEFSLDAKQTTHTLSQDSSPFPSSCKTTVYRVLLELLELCRREQVLLCFSTWHLTLLSFFIALLWGPPLAVRKAYSWLLCSRLDQTWISHMPNKLQTRRPPLSAFSLLF